MHQFFEKENRILAWNCRSVKWTANYICNNWEDNNKKNIGYTKIFCHNMHAVTAKVLVLSQHWHHKFGNGNDI